MPGSVQNPPIIGRIPWHRGRFVAAFAPPAFCSAYSNAMLFYHYFVLSLPLIMLGFAGYALVRWGKWPKLYADALSRFVLALAMPALLFATMSDYNRQPRLDGRLLLAFFGACLIVFVLGKPSLTCFRVLGRDAAQSRLALAPRTGRSHQLRVHLQAIGHPILGDELYAEDMIRDAAPRLLLHAERLAFVHPFGGATIEILSPPPF